MLITHSTFINSPASRVWAVTTDIDNWPDWAPTVQTAYRLDKQKFGVGSQASIKQPMQPHAIWTVTKFEAGTFFTWETEGKALHMRATHRVVGQGEGAKCTLTLKLAGPAAWLFAVFLVPMIWFALAQENRGLKRWCESNPGPTPAPDSTAHHSSSAGPANLKKG